MRHLCLLALLAAPAALAQGAVTVHSGTTFVREGARLHTSADLLVEAPATLSAAGGALAFTGDADQTFRLDGREGETFVVRSFSIDKPADASLAVYPALRITGTLGLHGGRLGLTEPATLAALTDARGIPPTPRVVSLAVIDGVGATLPRDKLVYERPYLDGGGWRMIASPFAVPFTDLNDDFHTQGAPGADHANGDPNLFFWDPTTPEGDDRHYVPVPDYAEPFAPGRGYFLYAYATDADDTAPILPTVWDVVGEEHGGSVVVPLGYDPEDADGRFNLLGNPYAAPLDWHAVQEGGAFQAAYYVWDPAANGGLGNYALYSTVGTSTGDAGRYVPPFQGFWAEATVSSPFGVTFDRDWTAVGESPVFVGRTAGPAELRFRLEGEGLEATEPVAVFLEGGATGPDAYDAAWLRPLSADYAALTFVRPDDGARLVFDGRPDAPDGTALGLAVEATRAGTYTLSWPDLDRAPAGAITLVDTETGHEVDLREVSGYTFEIASAAGPASGARLFARSGDAGEARFAVRLGTAVADEAGPAGAPLPTALALSAPSPNPTRGVVRLGFDLPSPGPVRLEVVDRLGRQVALVEAADRGAGHHTVPFDAGRLAVGLYYVRLRVGADVVVAPFSVIR